MKKDLVITRIFQVWALGLGCTFIVGFVMGVAHLIPLLIN